ncbi:Inositol-1-monophosphatase [Tritonibacter multivorans]|uniref:Inositol-1-monophosphatase n=1 Tax=Tritonibacter multivorans TaxID=928856 RepID=A0A0P1GE47_9RHOB|nr:inositol monophosphatase family protein [Tritonibacter multivorans]MDA7422502.1 inositol monophosphatase [Tritonibacter multivorans]CUH74815.1 Inositol-1-monophosphatase [Tritonibacter multivorans]SFD42084.1 histidinol-phosphatase, inositol monophosphatase family [Tritonibacter multivorans]
MADLDALMAHGARMAHIASETAMLFFRGELGVDFKADLSPVTQADKAVEAAIRAYLSDHFPDHGIFGEEEGRTGGDQAQLWVIDPIDGTRSFLSGHPLFGFLLAHLVDGAPQLGVIAMPALGEVFVAGRGASARLNGAPIQSSDVARLDQAILYVNEGDKLFRDHSAIFGRLMSSGQTRRFAYDCYPHALLAAGHVDAVVDYDLQPYDFLALAPIIEAAGGVVTDWQGQPLHLGSSGAIVSAATPELHRELLGVLNG